MTRSRPIKRSVQGPRLTIIIAFFIILILVLGYATNLFAVFKPAPEPATWPKIVSVHIGKFYERAGFFGIPTDRMLGKVDDDYKILEYNRVKKGWELQPAPSKTIIYCAEHTGYPEELWPRKKHKPSVWQYRESGDTVYFRIDPDEEDDGMPDLAIAIKFVKVQTYANYAVALYDVHVAIIGTSAREIPRLYKDTYFMVAFDSWYLLTGIRLNGEEQNTLVDDRSGKVKVMIWVPEAVPEHEAGDVWFWNYMLGLPVDAKTYDEVKALDIEYDPSVVVTSAETAYHYTAPTHTGPVITSYQTTGTKLQTTTVHHTVLIPVTTTKYITTYEVVYGTTTVGGKTVVVTTSTTITRKATITGLKTTTKKVTEGETVTIVVTKSKTTKIIEILEEIPWWVWAICAGSFLGMMLAISYAGARARVKKSRRGRRRR